MCVCVGGCFLVNPPLVGGNPDLLSPSAWPRNRTLGSGSCRCVEELPVLTWGRVKAVGEMGPGEQRDKKYLRPGSVTLWGRPRQLSGKESAVVQETQV